MSWLVSIRISSPPPPTFPSEKGVRCSSTSCQRARNFSSTLKRWLISMSQRFNVDEKFRARWQDVLEHLTPFSLGKVGGGGDEIRIDTSHDIYGPGEFVNLFHNRQRRNTENGELFSIYPMGLTGLGTSDYERGVRTYEERFFPMVRGYENSPVQAARLGLAEGAKNGILELISTSQLY